MSVQKTNPLSRVLEIAVWILMAAVVAMLVMLPWIVDWMLAHNTYFDVLKVAYWRPRYIITLAGSGFMALLMLWQARCLLHNANTGKIFTDSTVRCLRVFSVEAIVIALFYAVMLFTGMFKFSVAILALAFALGGVIAWVFAGFFRQATEYKKENDMTI